MYRESIILFLTIVSFTSSNGFRNYGYNSGRNPNRLMQIGRDYDRGLDRYEDRWYQNKIRGIESKSPILSIVGALQSNEIFDRPEIMREPHWDRNGYDLLAVDEEGDEDYLPEACDALYKYIHSGRRPTVLYNADNPEFPAQSMFRRRWSDDEDNPMDVPRPSLYRDPYNYGPHDPYDRYDGGLRGPPEMMGHQRPMYPSRGPNSRYPSSSSSDPWSEMPNNFRHKNVNVNTNIVGRRSEDVTNANVNTVYHHDQETRRKLFGTVPITKMRRFRAGNV